MTDEQKQAAIDALVAIEHTVQIVKQKVSCAEMGEARVSAHVLHAQVEALLDHQLPLQGCQLGGSDSWECRLHEGHHGDCIVQGVV